MLFVGDCCLLRRWLVFALCDCVLCVVSCRVSVLVVSCCLLFVVAC